MPPLLRSRFREHVIEEGLSLFTGFLDNDPMQPASLMAIACQ